MSGPGMRGRCLRNAVGFSALLYVAVFGIGAVVAHLISSR